MAQHWHGHWTEDTFKPKRLMNWEVPKWYPARPDRHCATTTFEANDRGHILKAKKRSKRSPWGDFKGTWDLPKKISRSMAQELSAPPEYKKKLWELHVTKNHEICENLKGPSNKRKRGGAEELVNCVTDYNKGEVGSSPRLETTQDDSLETAMNVTEEESRKIETQEKETC